MLKQVLWVLTTLCLAAGAEEPSPEVQLTTTSLRPDERARAERALGPLGALPFYRADLELDPTSRTVKGKVVVALTPKKALREVFLRVTPNASHDRVIVLSGAKVNGQAVTLDQPEVSLYRVKLSAPTTGPVQLEVTLYATVPRAPPGTGQLAASADSLQGKGGDYGAFSSAPEVTCLSGLLPMVPPERHGRPARGPSGIGDLGTFEPSNFLVSLTVPRGYEVVAPGNQLGVLPDGKGRVRFAYGVAAAREFPLLVTKGYEEKTVTAGEVVVESYFDAADQKAGATVADTAARALASLEEKLGPYPYRKFRVVEARLADGAGGMEFPGLITLSTALYRGTADPLAALGMPELGQNPMIAGLIQSALRPLLASTLEFTVDHEVAHQYFAMLVGNDPLEEPIVDEPLAQHTALLLLEWHHGKAQADQLRDAQLKTSYQLYRLMGGADGRADRPTSEYGSNAEYAALIYGKAPLLYGKLREEVGDLGWQKALRSYVDENRYRWATATTFTSLLIKQNPAHAAPIEALRRRWWEERHGDEDLGALDLGGLTLDPEMLEQYQHALDALSGGE